MEPYWQSEDKRYTVFHADCLEVLPQLEGVDLVITDPPYGFRKAGWDDEFPTEWFACAAKVTPVIGVMPGVWNIVRCPVAVGDLKYRWTLAAHLVNGMTRGVLGFGNWIPCLVYTTDDVSAYKQDGDIRDFVVGREDKPDHPSPKPLNVMRWLVERLPGNTVADPFMGSGTTGVACVNAGKSFIGMDISKQYCDLSVKRIKDALAQLPLVEV